MRGAGGEGRELEGGRLVHLHPLDVLAEVLLEVESHGRRAQALEVVDSVDVRFNVGGLARLEGQGGVTLYHGLDLRDELFPHAAGRVVGLDGLGQEGGEGRDATQGVPEGLVLLREGGQLLLHDGREVLQELLPTLLKDLDHIVEGAVQLPGDGAGLLRNLPLRPVHVGDGGFGGALDDGQRLRLLGQEVAELGDRRVFDVIVAVLLVVVEGALGAHQLLAVRAEQLQLEVVIWTRQDPAGGLRVARVNRGQLRTFGFRPL